MSKAVTTLLGFAAAFAMASFADAGVVKTKTKSNQSNDRCAASGPVAPTTGVEAGVVKTKTKSNQSNDRCAASDPIEPVENVHAPVADAPSSR